MLRVYLGNARCVVYTRVRVEGEDQTDGELYERCVIVAANKLGDRALCMGPCVNMHMHISFVSLI